jgi:hypothetical protein
LREAAATPIATAFGHFKLRQVEKDQVRLCDYPVRIAGALAQARTYSESLVTGVTDESCEYHRLG